MTTDQNARETASRVLRKNFPALGWVTSLADEVVDAYLAAVTAPEEVAEVVAQLNAHECGCGGIKDAATLILALHAGKAAEREQRITAERERDEFQRLWFDGEGYLGAAKARATAAESALATMTAERDRLRQGLEQISRMRTMPDDKINTWTLVVAGTIAARALTGGGDGK